VRVQPARVEDWEFPATLAKSPGMKLKLEILK
jgi:hypothetical protein